MYTTLFEGLRARRDAHRMVRVAPSTSHEAGGSWDEASGIIARRAKDQRRTIAHQIDRIGQLEDMTGFLDTEIVDILRGLDVIVRQSERLVRGEQSTDKMLNGLNIELLEHRVQLGSVGDALLTLLEKVTALEARLPEGGQNKSAAIIRDMRPVDAERCIRDPRPHQVVADELGLTYAQVYSCRLEYTFKEVHHKLKKEGFIPIWVRPGSRKR